MERKFVRVKEDVYKLLNGLKKKDESFSDVILRIMAMREGLLN